MTKIEISGLPAIARLIDELKKRQTEESNSSLPNTFYKSNRNFLPNTYGKNETNFFGETASGAIKK
jgi:hypothetical protein